MSENLNRSLIGVKPILSTDDRKTTASPPSISSTSTNRKVIIKSADMKEEMQTEAVNIAISLSVEKDVAEQIKKVFDKNHGPLVG
ncbi:putative dynein ATPase [Helianthus annuus]|nr:putative dynein ATPase [Helianthus annuus]